MEENNFVPPSDAVVTKSKKSNFVPPTDAILKKKVDSKPRSQEELWGSESQPQDLYTSLVTGAQEPQQESDGLGGPPKKKPSVLFPETPMGRPASSVMYETKQPVLVESTPLETKPKKYYRIVSDEKKAVEQQLSDLEERNTRLGRRPEDLTTEGTYQALQKQKAQLDQEFEPAQTAIKQIQRQSYTAYKPLERLVYGAKNGESSFFATDIINLNKDVEDKIIDRFDDAPEETKVKWYKGGLPVEAKEAIINSAKNEVLNDKYNILKKDADNYIKNIKDNPNITLEDKLKFQKDFKERSEGFNAQLALDYSGKLLKNNFKLTDINRDVDEGILSKYEGFIPDQLDNLSTFAEGMGQIVAKVATFLPTAALIGAERFNQVTGISRPEDYTAVEATEDWINDVTNLNFLPSSQTKRGKINYDKLLTGEGDSNLSLYSVGKTLANTLPFTLKIMSDVKKGRIDGTPQSMISQLINPKYSKDLADKLRVVETAYKGTLADNYKDAKEMGMDDSKALLYANVLSLAEGVSENIMPDYKYFDSLTGSTLKSLFKGNLKEAVTKQAAKNVTKDFFKNFVLETGEEEVILATEDALKYSLLLNHKNSEFFNMSRQKELVLTTAVLSGALGTVSVNQKFKQNKKDLYNSIHSNIYNLQDAFLDEIDSPLNDQKAKEALITAYKFANDVSAAISNAPENVTADQIDLLVQKKNLEEKKKTIDTAFHPDINEEITAIDTKIRELAKMPAVEEVAPAVEEVAPAEVAVEEITPVVEEVKPTEVDNRPISERQAEAESKIKRKDLFTGVGDFSSELGGSDTAAVPVSHKEVSGIELVEYAHPKTGSVDVIVTGKSDNDFVGFYRMYENGKPTNKWSSKFENQSRNKEDFKTMISGVQEVLPKGHEYIESTSISTDGLRIWNQQLGKGYELQYDENGKIKTNLVAINGDAIVNELGIDVNKGDFENIKVKSEEEFEKVKTKLIPYLEKFGLGESDIKWLTGTVKINLPVLKKTDTETTGAPKTQAEQYSEELDKTKESDPEAYWSVSPVSAADAAKGTIIDTPDGAAIVKPDGDIAGLFKKAMSKAKGVAQDLLKRAVAAGGKKLDNFDGYLTKQYEKAGFRIVSRVPFNEEYAPPGWNKEIHGTPDVVAMVYDPEGKLDIEEKTFDDYDEAMAYRDSLLEPSIDVELEGLAKLFDESDKGFRMSQVDNAKEALKGILPGVKFIVHETNEAYKNAVGDSSSGTYIMYSNGDKIIHINKQNANGRTVAHEVFHAVILDKIKGDKAVQEITARMVDAVYKTASPELKAKLDAFAARYSDKTIRDEERLAELIGIIADGYPKMSPANKSIVKRWLDALAKTFGLKPFTDNEVIDLLNTLAGKISTGEVISAEDVAILSEKEINIPGSQIIGSINIKLRRQAKVVDFDTTPPKVEGVNMIYPSKSDIKDVLEKSGGAAVFINSDGTKVGKVSINGRDIIVQGGIDYTFIKENVDDNIGFAASEDSKISYLKSMSEELIKERDAKNPQHKGKPIAVFVVAQNGETMLGEWYAAEYIMEGIDQSISKNEVVLEDIKKDFIDAIESAKLSGNKSGLADRKAKDKVLKMIKEGKFDTQKGRIEIAKEMASKEFSFGFRVNLNKELIAGNEKSWNSGKNRGIKKALSDVGHTMNDFWNKFLDERFLNKLNSTKLQANKGSSISNKTFSGFFYNPSDSLEDQVNHAKLGIDHAQFNSSFKSQENFLLDSAYDVNKLFPNMGYPTQSGIDLYNSKNKTDLNKKNMSIIDKIKVSTWLNKNNSSKLVVNPYSSISLSIYTGTINEEPNIEEEDKTIIRKQIVGENANLSQNVRDNLDVARDMESFNKSDKEIRLATGWEIGADKKWRYEVPDFKFKKVLLGKYDTETPLKNVIETALTGGLEQYNLEKILSNDELFNLYPDLKKVSLAITNSYKSGFQQMLPKGVDAAVFTDYGVKTIAVKPTKNIELLEATIAHEIQHIIQEKEGFAIGADFNEVGEEEYIKSAGEIESRNVEKRISMTPEERRKTTLKETEDVAREDQVIFFKRSQLSEDGVTINAKSNTSYTVTDNGNVVGSMQLTSDKALGKGYLSVDLSKLNEKYIGKGIGLDLYRVVANKLKDKGIVLTSSMFRNEKSDRVWKSLEKSGEAVEIYSDPKLKRTAYALVNPEVRRSQKVEWEESKLGRGDKAIIDRNPVLQNAADRYANKEISTEEYLKIKDVTSPIKPITDFIEPAKEADIKTAVGSKSEGKTNLEFEKGKSVGLRLDIPAYINKNIWAITVHEPNKGAAISYNNVARIENVTFESNPKVALDIARKKINKGTIARMTGNWVPISGKTSEQKGKNAMDFVNSILNNPEWSQIGMNPFRHSWFYDRADGKPVLAADELIQIGGLVYAKNVVKTTPYDKSFEFVDKAGDIMRFQQAKTIDEIVRIAKEAKYSDAAISAFLKAKGFSAEESTNAILGYNKKNIEARQKEEGIFTRDGKNKVLNSLSSFKRKFLSARSFLGKTTFIAKEGIEAGIKAQSKIASYLVSDLDNAIKKYDGDKEKIISDFDKFIRGESVSLPDNFLEIGNAMRAHIDKLSYELINSGVVDQAENIKKNIGTYLTRSYEVFDKKDWAKMVDEETLQAARNFLKKQLLSEATKEAKASGLDVDLILEKKVDQAITDLINREGAQSFVASGKTGSKDISILKQKTDIPLEIRALMGEYTDPAQNYSRTIFKVASLINNAKFLNTVRNNGIGVYLFEKNDINRPKEFDTLIAAEGSETMNPLNGLYTTKEMAESLKESAGILNAIEVALPYSISGTVKSTYEYYMKLLGSVKWLKTIASVGTHFKNVSGNVTFMLANGYFKPDAYRQSAKAIYNDFLKKTDQELRDKMQEYIEAGIIDQSAVLGELRSMFKEEDFDKSFERRMNSEKLNSTNRFIDRVKRLGKKGAELAQNAYQAEDDYFKIVSYETEKNRYAKAMFRNDYSKLSEDEQGEVRDRVTEITKNVLPNYGRVPGAVKLVKAFPVVGTFISFQTEALRTAYNIVNLSVTELKSSNPEIKKIGALRMSGIIASQAIKYGVMYLIGGSMLGDDDDEKKENAKRFVAPWSKNSNVLITKEGDGKFSYIDFSASDPFGGIVKPLNAAMQGKDLLDGFIQGTKELVSPFTNPDILKSMFTEISENKDSYGNQLYNPSDTFEVKSSAILSRVYKTFEPGTATSIRKISKSDSTLNEMAGQFTGYKENDIDLTKQFSFKISDMKKMEVETRNIYNRAFRKFENKEITDAELEAAYNQSNKATIDTYKELKKDYDAAIFFGTDYKDLKEEMKRSKVSKDVIRGITTGDFKDLKKKEGIETDAQLKARNPRVFAKIMAFRERRKKAQ
jgi:hypothetical protein